MIQAKYILVDVTIWLERNGDVRSDHTGAPSITDEECISFAKLIHAIRNKPIKGIDQAVANCLAQSRNQRHYRQLISLALLPGHPDLVVS